MWSGRRHTPSTAPALRSGPGGPARPRRRWEVRRGIVQVVEKGNALVLAELPARAGRARCEAHWAGAQLLGAASILLPVCG